MIKIQFTKTLDLTPRHQRISLLISFVSSKRSPRPLALIVASKIMSWKKPTKKAKKIKFKIALSRIIATAEIPRDIQWGQFHSRNFSTKWGNKTRIENPIEKILKIIVKMMGLKVLSHNAYNFIYSLVIKGSKEDLVWAVPWDE